MTTRSGRSKSVKSATTVAVVLTAYMAVVFGLGLYLFSLLASEMRQTLGFALHTIGTITAAAQITFLIAAALCPMAAKRFGDIRVSVAAVIAAGVTLAAVSLVNSSVSVAILVAFLGACAAFMVIPTVGVIARTVAPEYRSRVNGLVSSGTAYGQLAAGSLAPILVVEAGWRSVWLVFGIASVFLAVFGYAALKALAPSAFVATKASDGSLQGQASPSPNLFNATNIKIWALLAASGMVCGPWQNYLSSFLTSEEDHTIQLVGNLWSIIGFLGLFSGFAVGFLADRLGIKPALASSYAVLALAAGLVAAHNGVAMLYAAATCFGLSFFAVYGLIPAYITKTMEEAQTTAVFAGANICLGLGTAFGNLASGYIPNLTGSLQQVYVSIACIALAAALLVLALPSEKNSQRRY